ncbi:hypothetical protein PFLU3_51740 [Pseudomonas fluorescens]|uniref:Uncharacterized protein n=1 Tax=Pseudomonas fluorescens TaxID=294 RepID=A0A0D0T6I0_PSEFL|nr:hypothetical protein C4K02_3675 [Pseudomonas synxantha]KIR17889.1 hypothetical protein PFLU3_51740 [Pseudomonas fluorescens]
MKNIPHDYYLRFLDHSVYDAVLEFHCKGNFIFHEAFQACTGLHSLDQKRLKQLTGNELVLYPDMDITVELDFSEEDRASWLYRNESCEKFSPEPLAFKSLNKLVAPLVSRSIGEISEDIRVRERYTQLKYLFVPSLIIILTGPPMAIFYICCPNLESLKCCRRRWILRMSKRLF